MNQAPVIAVDIGGTRMRAAVVTRDGTILNRIDAATPARHGAEALSRTMLAMIDEVRAHHGQPCAAIGICTPGPIDMQRGVPLADYTIQGLAELPLAQLASDHCRLPTTLESDGIAAAIGEWRFGAGRGCDHMVYVTLSTGIGGGAIISGQPLRGRSGAACHFGHMVLDPDGPRCFCGATGCWEAMASGSALNTRALAAGYASLIDLLNHADRQDPAAMAERDAAGRLIGLGIVSLLHVFDPDRVVLGGGVAQSLTAFLPSIEETIAARALAVFRKTPVVQTALEGDAGLLGAADLAFAL